MDIDITLKNYRCFPDSSPARINLRNGFTSFIGANNSGKSSLLKFFFEFRPIFQALTPNTQTVLSVLQGHAQSFGPVPTIYDWNEIFSNTNDRDLEIEIALPEIKEARAIYSCPFANRIVFRVARATNSWTAEVFVGSTPLVSRNTSYSFMGDDNIGVADRPVADLSEIFRATKILINSLYVGPFRNAVNIGSNDAYFDIQVGQGFISSWKFYKSGNLKKQNEACHRLTEDIKKIFGYSDLDISSSADERSLQVLIDGKSFKLPEVGSGLTQFILVLATAAMKAPSYILIDEPELNLHPSLQLDFLTTLASYSKNGVLFATHSIGLARGSADRIYSVKRLEAGVSQLRDLEGTPQLAEFLGELGFSSYKELGFEKILLVEGRTEVKAVQQFLRLMKKDHQVVLIPMGGSEMINGNSESELAELTRISAHVSALIDSERASANENVSKNRQAFMEICRKVGINCKLLDNRALENYLSDRAIKKLKGPTYQALTPYQKRETLSPMWAKTENWRIAREMTVDELFTTDLGQFLNNL